MADIDSYGVVGDRAYEYRADAVRESLSPAQLHDLAMFYLKQTAYEGITPEQLVGEYFLAIEHISDLVRIRTNEMTPRDERPQGHRLEDGAVQQ